MYTSTDVLWRFVLRIFYGLNTSKLSSAPVRADMDNSIFRLCLAAKYLLVDFPPTI